MEYISREALPKKRQRGFFLDEDFNAGGIPARVKEYYECCQNDTRPSWCPLVPVPPHGRLIDGDALSAKLNKMIAMAFGEGNTAFHFAYRSLGKVVENTPTIIPASGGTDNE